MSTLTSTLIGFRFRLKLKKMPILIFHKSMDKKESKRVMMIIKNGINGALTQKKEKFY